MLNTHNVKEDLNVSEKISKVFTELCTIFNTTFKTLQNRVATVY